MKVVVGLGRGGGTQAALVPSHRHLSIVKSMTTLQLNSDNGGQQGGGGGGTGEKPQSNRWDLS